MVVGQASKTTCGHL